MASLTVFGLLVALLAQSWLTVGQTCKVTTQHLSDPPYENYFYSDCHVDAQAVVTSPLPDSNLTIIGPRLIIAWPAGNSGICTFFQPQSGGNGSLALKLVNSTVGKPLAPVYNLPAGAKYATVGVTGVLTFNNSAALTIPILGGVRTIRDFTEGPSLLRPVIQDAINVSVYKKSGAQMSRLWLDNITTSTFTLFPYGNTNTKIQIENKTLMFEAGAYVFTATINYPQLEQLTASEVLSTSSKGLINQMPGDTTSLSFLSYTEKLLAGAWRFLTYFGRDSMISALLMQPILSQGNGSAMEAVLGAVLERLNRSDGSVCHEETIGDYATYLNLEENITSTAPSYSYIMIDSDYYLPILMNQYLTQSTVGKTRVSAFLSKNAGSINPANLNLTYGNLTVINAEKIMNLAAPFVASGGQTIANLDHLKTGQIVGEWRDSTYGIGGGRIPFDVNTALMPAALRAIGSLARFNSSIFPTHANWSTLADTYAEVWEDETLAFFETNITRATAASRLQAFTQKSTFYHGPAEVSSLPASSSANITTYAVSLNGYNDLAKVDVMHTDTSFRLFLLNTTNNAQLTRLLNATADSIVRPFPAGLRTPVGIVVANPALGAEAVLTQNFTNAAYHGTVVWSWTQAMMAKGLEHQLGRCNASTAVPDLDFCRNPYTYAHIRKAYNMLWDVIEANSAQLSSEVWSWVYANGKYTTTPLGALPPPPGISAGTESDVRQLWSLTFLAVKRNTNL